jgi:hypothetical protein
MAKEQCPNCNIDMDLREMADGIMKACGVCSLGWYVGETRIKYELYDRVKRFIEENDIDCDDTIYQTDRVIINAYDFIADLLAIIEPSLTKEASE